MLCPPAVLPHLVGRQGAAARQFERDTGARLTFPPRQQQQQAAQVTVSAPTPGALRAAVATLQATIQAKAASAQQQLPDYNAFVSVPLGPSSEALRAAVREFQRRALAAYKGVC